MKIINAAKARFRAWIYYQKGNITFAQASSLMIPSRFRSKEAMTGMLLGKPFVIPPGIVGEFVGYINQIVTSDQYQVSLIKENAIVFDAGANMGVFSVFAAATHPDATIYAFEPTPSSFAALQENASHYKNIKVFNCALGDIEKMTSIIVVPTDSGSNHIGEGGIPISMKTIDSFNQNVDFLKMDTEGYEGPIIKGAAETIKRSRPIIVMSAYHKPNDKIELPALLNSITPYDCELRHDSEEDLVCVAK